MIHRRWGPILFLWGRVTLLSAMTFSLKFKDTNFEKSFLHSFLFLRKCQKAVECLMTHRCPRFFRDIGNWGHCHVMRVWNFEILKSNFIQRRSKLDGGSFVRTKTQWRAGQQKPMADQNAMHSPAFLAQPSFLCNKALPEKESARTFMILAVLEKFWRHLVPNRK